MPTTTYRLGRDCVAELPGIVNDDVVDVTVTASASQQDVTTFKSTALTQYEYMAGLIEITIDVVCTNHACEIGDHGTQEVAGLPSDLDAEVLEVKEGVGPKGRVEYTITYGLREPDAA